MTDKTKNGGGFFGRIRTKLSGADTGGTQPVVLGAARDGFSASENLRIIEEYEAVKENAAAITGWDFDRAFDFLEKHPDTDLAKKLQREMYSTTSSTLKGLSYQSAVKILQRMPDHPGVQSIVKGMRNVEKSYIAELKSDIIAYMLEIIPDHPLMEDLATALAVKNLTNAYDFIERNPTHPCTRLVIQAMFARDANIATLLLHERMDHPQVDAIFQGIYSIDSEAVSKMMPDAILFILDVATDHPCVDQLLETLVEKNYVRAFEFVQANPGHSLAEKAVALLRKRKPELADLLDRKAKESGD